MMHIDKPFFVFPSLDLCGFHILLPLLLPVLAASTQMFSSMLNELGPSILTRSLCQRYASVQLVSFRFFFQRNFYVPRLHRLGVPTEKHVVSFGQRIQ